MKRSRRYLLGEAALILFWAYVGLVGGGLTSQINIRLQAANAVLGAVLLGGWLVWRLARGRAIPRSGFDAGVVLFLGALVVATVYSHDPRRSLPALSTYVTWALFFYFWLDVLKSGAPAELLEKTLLIIGGVVIAFGLLDAVNSIRDWRSLTLNGTLPFAPPYLFRLYSWLGDANLGAAAVNLLIPPALARGLNARGGARLGWWIYALLALAFVYFTSSRGGWLGTAAGLATLALLAALDSRRPGEHPLALVEWFSRLPRLIGWLRQRPVAAVASLVLVGVLVVGAGALILQQSAGPTHGPLLSARDAFWSAAWQAFIADPLTGQGLGTYPSAFTRYGGVPPERPYLHAHSVPFTLLAEAGLNGGLGLIVLLTAMTVAFQRLRQPAERPRRAAEGMARQPGKPILPPPLLAVAGPLASLAGLAVHSLFDNHLFFGAVAIPAACFVAMVYHGAGVPPARPAAATPRPGRRAPGLSPWAFLAAGLAVVSIAAYSLWGYLAFERGLQAAGRGAWGEAAARFDEASQRDPYFSFYRFQAGFAYGMAAAGGDAGALAKAIERYEAGLALEPDYSLNHASLGALYLEAGRPAEARAEFRQAVSLAGDSGSWLYWLNYGAAAEAEGDQAGAEAAYRDALQRRPSISEAAFWQASPLRQTVVEAWRNETPPPGDALNQGARLLEAGDPAGAQAAFEAAWGADPLRPQVYHGLALVAVERGDDALADAYLRAALSLQTAENDSKVLPLLTWAELSARAGRLEESRQKYEGAYAAVAGASVFGWTGQGFSPYGWFAFGRESLPVDLLPQVIRADVSRELAARFLPLGEMLEAAGDADRAVEVYRQLLAFDPGLDAARQRLATLGEG